MYQERPACRYLWQWSGVGRWINRSDIDRTELGGDMQQCRSREHVIPATAGAENRRRPGRALRRGRSQRSRGPSTPSRRSGDVEQDHRLASIDFRGHRQGAHQERDAHARCVRSNPRRQHRDGPGFSAVANRKNYPPVPLSRILASPDAIYRPRSRSRRWSGWQPGRGGRERQDSSSPSPTRTSDLWSRTARFEPTSTTVGRIH